MTRKLLEQYRDMKSELMELLYPMDPAGINRAVNGHDALHEDSDGHLPPHAIQDLWYHMESKQERKEKRKKLLEKKCQEVEEFIDSIQDIKARRVLKMYYIDGVKRPTQAAVGKRMYMHQGQVSKRIRKCLALCEEGEKLGDTE